MMWVPEWAIFSLIAMQIAHSGTDIIMELRPYYTFSKSMYINDKKSDKSPIFVKGRYDFDNHSNVVFFFWKMYVIHLEIFI